MARRKYGSRHSSKIDMVMAILAEGIYRPWFWANYKDEAKQRVLRYQWDRAVSRFERGEIKVGLKRWESQFGIANPPTPEAFADFIRPKHSAHSRAHLDQIKQALSG